MAAAKNQRRGRLVAVLLAVLACAIGCAFWWQRRSEGDVTQRRTVAVTELREARVVRQRGLLESAGAEPAIVRTHGYILKIVDQGTPIRKGELVFSMDDSFARVSIEGSEDVIEKEALSREIIEASLRLTQFREREEASLHTAELAHAKLAEAEELGHPTKSELRLLEMDLRLSNLDLEDAREELARQQRLRKKNFISASALEPYERRVQVAEAYVAEKKHNIAIEKKGASQETRIELRRAVERSEARAQRAMRHVVRRIKEIEQQLAASTTRLASLEHRLERSRKEIAGAEVRAQRDGVVRIRDYYDWRSGGVRREYKAGVEKRPQDIIADVIDLGSMRVNLVINEADFHDLREGMPVRVIMPAFPERVFPGRLEQLGAIGRDRNQIDPTASGGAQSGIMMFNAEISFDGQGARFHPGMSAMVEIVATQSTTGLALPREAVALDGDGVGTVHKLNDNGEAPISIRGRVFNERWFAIEEGQGLAKGDLVVIPETGGTDERR
ncbi:MAG: hypothetical protein KAI66_13990 [Lentisphaeria bacterium]|nr:hypothetical protein [Lentisphaeria bacterium]